MSLLPRFTVLYDGGCPLCRRTVRALAGLDWFGRLSFSDATDDALRERLAPGLSREDALASMYVLDERGSRTAGFDGYLQLSQGLPILWVPRWIGLLPPAGWLGRRIYGMVAARRARQGTCSDEVCEPPIATTFPRQALGIALVATVLLAALGAGLNTLALVPFAHVDVRWHGDVPEPARRVVAARHSLYVLRHDDGIAQYALADTSRDNVEALLRFDGIEVSRLDPVSGAPTAIQHVSVPRWMTIRYGWNLGGVLTPISIAPLTVICLFLALLARPEGRAWLAERIPAADADAMGLFRIALALALLLAILFGPLVPGARLLLSVLLLGFGLGLLPRVCLALFIVALAWLTPVDDHDLNLPFKTWCLLLLVPWGDAPGLLNAWRQKPHADLRPAVSRRYGLAFWIPMFTLGLAYLAAAYAKLAVSGTQWITGGAIRYFLVVDGHNAPGSLWRVVAANDGLSVLLSFGAVATEATIIVGALWYSPMLATAAGLGAVALHGGFWILQGVWWPFWWALLPAFLPWTAIAARLRRSPVSRAPNVEAPGILAACGVLVFVLTQGAASLLQVERPPLLSNFPMYSDVQWESKDAFAAQRDEGRSGLPLVRLRSLAAAPTSGAPDCLTDDERVAQDVRDHRQPGGSVWERLVACTATWSSGNGRLTAAVDVAPGRFDWTTVGFVPSGPWQQAGVLQLPDAQIAW